MQWDPEPQIYIPPRARFRMEQEERQPPEVWIIDDEDGGAVDRYLTKMHRESDPHTSLSSAKEWVQVGGKSPWDLSDGERNTLQKQCHKLYFVNPFAGSVIDNYTFYVNGEEGLTVSWINPNVVSWWEMLKRRNKWTKLSRDIVQLTFITGECFCAMFPLTMPATEGESNQIQKKLDIRIIHPTEISKIETNPIDKLQILKYFRGEAKLEYSPTDLVFFKVHDVGGTLRGRPILERVIQGIAIFDDWLISRANLNRMRSRLPVIRYRSGLKKSGFPIRSLPEAGTVIDAHKDVEQWEFPSLNINAGDASEDAQEIKNYIAAGVNLPAYMITGEGASANVISGTPMKMFRSFQGLFKDFFHELFEKLMPEEYKENVPVLSFPEVDLRDFSNRAEAIMGEYQNGLRSKHSAQVALGLDPEEEQQWMQKELGLTKTETEELPEPLLRKIVNSVLFHAPAVSAGRMENGFIEAIANEFDKRGWLKRE